MNQPEVLFIIQHRGPITAMEISELVGERPENISIMCLKLHRKGVVTRRELDEKGGPYEYRLNSFADYMEES